MKESSPEVQAFRKALRSLPDIKWVFRGRDVYTVKGARLLDPFSDHGSAFCALKNNAQEVLAELNRAQQLSDFHEARCETMMDTLREVTVERDKLMEEKGFAGLLDAYKARVRKEFLEKEAQYQHKIEILEGQRASLQDNLDAQLTRVQELKDHLARREREIHEAHRVLAYHNDAEYRKWEAQYLSDKVKDPQPADPEYDEWVKSYASR